MFCQFSKALSLSITTAYSGNVARGFDAFEKGQGIAHVACLANSREAGHGRAACDADAAEEDVNT